MSLRRLAEFVHEMNTGIPSDPNYKPPDHSAMLTSVICLAFACWLIVNTITAIGLEAFYLTDVLPEFVSIKMTDGGTACPALVVLWIALAIVSGVAHYWAGVFVFEVLKGRGKKWD